VARKYHMMAALPNIGVEKIVPFSATTRPTYMKPGNLVRKRRSQTQSF